MVCCATVVIDALLEKVGLDRESQGKEKLKLRFVVRLFTFLKGSIRKLGVQV
jgi:hypothetical protein